MGKIETQKRLEKETLIKELLVTLKVEIKKSIHPTTFKLEKGQKELVLAILKRSAIPLGEKGKSAISALLEYKRFPIPLSNGLEFWLSSKFKNKN
jgi:hypothetical protein